MSKRRRDKNKNRHFYVWLLATWSLLRALLPWVAFLGAYTSYESFAIVFEDPSTYNSASPSKTLSLWQWAISPDGVTTFTVTLLSFFVFLALTIGIYRGFKWGPIGFIIASTLLLLWSARSIFGPFTLYAPIFYALSATLFAIFLIRQPATRHFFDLNIGFRFLQIKRVAIDFILGLISLFAAISINYFGI